jgi:hypothetical protein
VTWHPVHFSGEVGVGGGLPGLGGLPSDPARVLDLPDGLAADARDPGHRQIIGELA